MIQVISKTLLTFHISKRKEDRDNFKIFNKYFSNDYIKFLIVSKTMIKNFKNYQSQMRYENVYREILYNK